MIVRNLRRFKKNSLLAFFDLQLASGLMLRGCMLHLSHDKYWAGLPARPYKDASGKDSWTNIVDFRGKATRNRFQRLATEMALAAYRESEVAA